MTRAEFIASMLRSGFRRAAVVKPGEVFALDHETGLHLAALDTEDGDIIHYQLDRGTQGGEYRAVLYGQVPTQNWGAWIEKRLAEPLPKDAPTVRPYFWDLDRPLVFGPVT